MRFINEGNRIISYIKKTQNKYNMLTHIGSTDLGISIDEYNI